MWTKFQVARSSARKDWNLLFFNVIACEGRTVIILRIFKIVERKLDLSEAWVGNFIPPLCSHDPHITGFFIK